MESTTCAAPETNAISESILTKRSRVEISSSPEHHLTKLQKLTGENCGHCNKKCTSRGKLSEALQCDLCYTWVHAQCEGLTKDHYKVINQISNEVPGITYLCKVNHCCNRFKQLLFSFINCSTANSTSVDTQISDSLKNKEVLSSMCDNVKESLRTSITEVSTKIDRLLSRNDDLQMEISSASEQIDVPAKTSAAAATASTALNVNILDELADRDRRRKNLIIYNFPENSDHQADKAKFLELSKLVFNLDLNITKIIRLGKRNDEKRRPLLVGLDSDAAKIEVLSQSGKLCRFDQYNEVYIVADKTKYEREKHKKLVNELKSRRSKGEKNLIIRNGNIVATVPRSQVPADQQPSNGLSNSSSNS